MKLQRIETRRGDKIYVKHQVVIPNKIVAQAGWKPRDIINVDFDRKGRVVLSASSPRPRYEKVTYDQLRDAVKQILVSEPSGLTWSGIRKKMPTLPSKPSAIWVKRMEIEIGLNRTIERETYHTLWRIPPPSTLNGWS